jgi:hypothetical protein
MGRIRLLRIFLMLSMHFSGKSREKGRIHAGESK